MMTEKDHNLLAAALRSDAQHLDRAAYPDGFDYAVATGWEKGAYDQYHTVVVVLAQVLAIDNPRFDYSKFLEACGMSSL